MKALLIGSPPRGLQDYQFVDAPPYEAVVIGSLTVGLKFMDQTATMGQRIGNGLLYFIPSILALAAYILSFIKNRGEKHDN